MAGKGPNTHEVPCGSALFRTENEAVRHAATCAACRIAVQAQQMVATGPQPGTVNLRRSAGIEAERCVAAYVNGIDSSNDHVRTQRILGAIGNLERALYYETRGAYGKEHAHAGSVAQAQRNPKPGG